jgi:hypothetical protein
MENSENADPAKNAPKSDFPSKRTNVKTEEGTYSETGPLNPDPNFPNTMSDLYDIANHIEAFSQPVPKNREGEHQNNSTQSFLSSTFKVFA